MVETGIRLEKGNTYRARNGTLWLVFRKEQAGWMCWKARQVGGPIEFVHRYNDDGTFAVVTAPNQRVSEHPLDLVAEMSDPKERT